MNSHVSIRPSILYFGTPVLLLTTRNPDGTVNLAPMSSGWALGQTLVLGMSLASRTAENLQRHPEFVASAPGPELWRETDLLGGLTGRDPVPEHKRSHARFEPEKFAAAGLHPQPSDVVSVPRVAECRLQFEARVARAVPDTAQGFLTIEAEVVAVHAHPDIVIPGTQHVDPRRWSPLIYNFRHYHGLAPQVGESARTATPTATPGASAPTRRGIGLAPDPL